MTQLQSATLEHGAVKVGTVHELLTSLGTAVHWYGSLQVSQNYEQALRRFGGTDA